MNLTAFWLIPPQPPPPEPGRVVLDGPPAGLGATAFDLDDALWMLGQTDYTNYIRVGLDDVVVRRAVRFTELPEHVQRTMGPIVVRGVWYPVWRPFTTRR